MLSSLGLLISCALILSFGKISVNATPLDDYVNTPDSHYKYEMITIFETYGAKVYILNMTSQKWQDETFVESPIWWHVLVISIPDKITRPDAAFMLIDGGKNDYGYRIVLLKVTNNQYPIHQNYLIPNYEINESYIFINNEKIHTFCKKLV